MNENNDKAILSLLQNLQKCVKTYGVDEINNAVVSFLNKKEETKDEVDIILELVCEEYEITKRKLLHSTERKSVQEARIAAYCLLHFELCLSIRHIAEKVFGKWINSVGSAIRHYKRMDASVKEHEAFMNRYNRLKKKVEQKLKTTKI